ncbi:hypothetical protein SESBI_38651 [Sesbania bispinosa]|nr:hypothetical protein SESBI_38651 [Sesbania bispinosa]
MTCDKGLHSSINSPPPLHCSLFYKPPPHLHHMLVVLLFFKSPPSELDQPNNSSQY